mmetsp:Transcript_6953/g.20857  ORF Transcript_6953/g.20857 Transcript_6953/m.20857 type:complete len:97 (-) Transcript_6953:1404-1694(-)
MSDVRLLACLTVTTPTRPAPTILQPDVAYTDNNNINNLATPPRGKHSRNLADELSSPVPPRKTQKKVSLMREQGSLPNDATLQPASQDSTPALLTL